MDYKRDVFVSYSSSDLTWVDSELLKRLREARVAYIEPRDFRPGVPVIREIENAITTSRRTLLIVSRNYLGDTFSEFENGMALAHSIRSRRWSVIPVITEENVTLPISIDSLVKSNLATPTEEDWEDFTRVLSSEPPADNAHKERQEAPQNGGNISRPLVQKPAAPDNHAARNGLNLLLELMSDPEVSSAITEFRTDFEELCQRMQKLKLLKGLHDKFQELESSANLVFNYAKPNSSGFVAWDDMLIPESDLTANLQDLVDMACDSKFAEPQDIWVQRLIRGQQELQEGVAQKMLELVRGAGRRLSAVLDTLPAKINVQMVTEARALRLTSLENALMTVHGILRNLQPNPHTEGQLGRIDESARKIDEMDQVLRTVLYVHDFLQEIDTELRRIEASIYDGVQQIVDLLQEVNPKIQIICNGNLNEWAIRLSLATVELKRSLPSETTGTFDNVNDFSEVRRQFLLFRKQVTRSFNRVDQDLIRKCNELEAEIQKPLAPLLALLQTI